MKGKTQTVNVSNTYNPSYQLTVKKTVKGNQGNKASDFKFQIMLTGNSIPKNINVIKNGKADKITLTNGIAEFTLAHGDEIIICRRFQVNQNIQSQNLTEKAEDIP